MQKLFIFSGFRNVKYMGMVQNLEAIKDPDFKWIQ